MTLTELAAPAQVVQRRGWAGQLAGLGRGAWQGLRDTYDFMHRMSPERALVDPMGAVRDRLLFGQALLGDVRHPVAAAEAVADVDKLRDGAYGEWLGGLVAGAAIPGGRIGRLEGLGARTAIRLVDKGGPVTVRIGLRIPRGYPVHIQDLKPERRRHILDGDETGGGHRAGTGIPRKTEFPRSWSDDQIIERVMKTAMKPERVEARDSGRLAAWATHDGVSVKVIVGRDGQVITAHPEPGGPGVVRNPRAR